MKTIAMELLIKLVIIIVANITFALLKVSCRFVLITGHVDHYVLLFSQITLSATLFVFTLGQCRPCILFSNPVYNFEVRTSL
jgi:hypothetical protein